MDIKGRVQQIDTLWDSSRNHRKNTCRNRLGGKTAEKNGDRSTLEQKEGGQPRTSTKQPRCKTLINLDWSLRGSSIMGELYG